MNDNNDEGFYANYLQTNYPKRSRENGNDSRDVRGRKDDFERTIRRGDGERTRPTGKGDKSGKTITRKKVHPDHSPKIITHCPYCGAKNMVNVNGIPSNQVVTCDIYSDGCDKVFVVSMSHVVLSETKKIEGE